MKRILFLATCSLIASFGFAQAPNAGTSYSLWSTSAVPAIQSFEDATPNELGVKFYSDSNGYITAIRFYKGPLNQGVHVAHLWDNQGNLLASATFTNETASGWQQVMLPNPVPITAGTVYVASYWDPDGGYALNRPYFTAQYNNGPLHALADGANGANGIYLYNSSGFPTSTYDASNYWVDVVFVPSSAPSPSQKEATGANGSSSSTTPSISSISPAAGPIAGGTSVTINGSNFESGATVSFGSAQATSVQFVNSTQLQAVTPAGAVGSANIVVTNPNAGSASLANAFTYNAGPAVTSVSPASGPAAGGTTVTISGSGFVNGDGVAFGVTPAASVTVVSPTQIQAVTPAEGAAGVGVTVTDPNGGPTTLASAFTFLSASLPTPPPPSSGALLTGMTPSNYTLPSGWTLVTTDNFESGSLPPGQGFYGGSNQESINCSFAHTGNCSLDTYVTHSYGGIGLIINGNYINSREIYVSFWQYSQQNNPGYGLAYTDWYMLDRTQPGVMETIPDWEIPGSGPCGESKAATSYGGCDPAQVSFYNAGYSPLPNWSLYLGTQSELLGQWVQYEFHLKENDPGQANGDWEWYQNGRLIEQVNSSTQSPRCPGGAYYNGPPQSLSGCGNFVGNYDASTAALYIGGDWGDDIPGTGDNENIAACVGGINIYTSPPTPLTPQQACPPNGNIPYWHDYIDDVIVLKK
jgi:hypothetical protein